MQFKVPQFIDVEDKLFGPFTFKQFVYMAGGGGIIFIIYKLLPFFVGIFIILPVALLTFLLTFYKINNKPFSHYLQAGIAYLFSTRLYVWKQRLAKSENTEESSIHSYSKDKLLPTNSPERIGSISNRLDIPNNTEDN